MTLIGYTMMCEQGGSDKFGQAIADFAETYAEPERARLRRAPGRREKEARLNPQPRSKRAPGRPRIRSGSGLSRRDASPKVEAPQSRSPRSACRRDGRHRR